MGQTPCFHCGLHCSSQIIHLDDKVFCCNGCKTVYELLSSHDLMTYYDLGGAQQSSFISKQHYAFLENTEITAELLEFDQGDHQVVNLHIPSIHCSSCIYVLEQLNKFHVGVYSSLVNFTKKEVRITFDQKRISLKSLAELLDKLGYPPLIRLNEKEDRQQTQSTSILYKIGLAGFAFGNIMFLSFPEYFDIDEFWLNQYKYVFRYLMLALILPVVFYAAQDYFISAKKGISSKTLNIDVPIVIGILVLFIRSLIEIITDTGSGYLDSLSGLVFFLLLGKYFQSKTYEFLSFERDYKSYFPLGITKLDEQHNQISIQTNDIKIGDQLLIRHDEIIPVDAILLSDSAEIDYSFVTGESHVVTVKKGQLIYAGGKQLSAHITIESKSSIQQSKLVQLWNNDVFRNNQKKQSMSLIDQVARHFTVIILGIAILTGLFWTIVDKDLIWNTTTAVLIIACPCALALSGPFAFGNLSRILSKKGCFAKNTNALERLCTIDIVVFDKTGTLTSNQNAKISFVGDPLSNYDLNLVKTLVDQSNHPLSRLVSDYLGPQTKLPIKSFISTTGQGIEAEIDDHHVKLGAPTFVQTISLDAKSSQVHVAIDNQYKGAFVIDSPFREGIDVLMQALGKHYPITILTGDRDASKSQLKTIIPSGSQLMFNQSPMDKLRYIELLQKKGKRVMMVGDGLNDAGALAQSEVGIAISEDINVFSPACDFILKSDKIKHLLSFIKLAKTTKTIVKLSLILSFLYNIIGLYFAVTGQLTPIVAAILMPLSSITVVAFVTSATSIFGRMLP